MTGEGRSGLGPGLLGGVIGLLVVGAVGQGLGFLYLELFGGPYCCGLEGLLPPVFCAIAGAGVGAAAGAGVGIVGTRPDKAVPKVRVLLGLWAALIVVAWAVGSALGFEVEGGPGLPLYIVLTLILPFALWNRVSTWLESRNGTDQPL